MSHTGYHIPYIMSLLVGCWVINEETSIAVLRIDRSHPKMRLHLLLWVICGVEAAPALRILLVINGKPWQDQKDRMIAKWRQVASQDSAQNPEWNNSYSNEDEEEVEEDDQVDEENINARKYVSVKRVVGSPAYIKGHVRDFAYEPFEA